MTVNNHPCSPEVFELTPKQRNTLHSGGIAIVLTKDDIITLKQERDAYRQALFLQREHFRENKNYRLVFETLERILGQIH